MILQLLAQATSPTSNSTAAGSDALTVVIIGAVVSVIGLYFTHRGTKKQTEVTSESQKDDANLKEREFLAEEWRALREYQSVQLSAARKEIENLEASVRNWKATAAEKDAQLDAFRDEIFTLKHSNNQLERNNASQKRQLDFPSADK